MDIQDVINKEVAKQIQERLPEIIEKNITKMLEQVMNDIFHGYNGVQPKVKEQMSNALDINLSEHQITSYNHLVSKTIADSLNQNIDVEPIQKMVKNLIGKLPYSQINLSEMVEEIKQYAIDDCDYDEYGNITVHVEQVDSDYGTGWKRISIDLEDDIRVDSCAVKFLVANGNGRIFSMSRKNKKDVTAADVANFSHKQLENYIYSHYNNQVKIIIDEADIETGW